MLCPIGHEYGRITMNNMTFSVKCKLILPQLFLIIMWASVLHSTDSLYAVYALCAIISALCLFDNCFYTNNVSIVKDLKLRWTILLLSVLFSLAPVLANYSIFTSVVSLQINEVMNLILNVVRVLCAFVGGVCVAFHIMVFALQHLPLDLSLCKDRQKNCKWVFWCSFAVFVLIDCVNLFFIEYPGNLSWDPKLQIDQIYSGEYTSSIPFWHTMAMKLGLTMGYQLFGNANAALAFTNFCQVLLVSLCFSYAVMTLYEAKFPGWCVFLSFAVYGFMPYNIALSITLWKDVPFAHAMLLMAAAMLRCFRRIGRKQIWNYVVFALGGILMCLSRSNGLITFVFAIIFMVPFLWKYDRCLIKVIAVVLVVCLIISGPVLSLFPIVDASDSMEMLGIPIQQVARVIVAGCELTQEQVDLISKVISIDRIKELYSNWIVDPIKVEIRFGGNVEIFQDNIGEFAKLWVQLGLKYPWEYVKAWIDQTKGYWNGGYDYYQYAEMMYENTYGFEKIDGNPLLVRAKYLVFAFTRFFVLFHPLNSIGLHVWIMGLCVFVNMWKKRKEYLLAFPALAMILTLWLSTPVYSEFRYAYSVFITMPLVLLSTVFTGEDVNSAQSMEQN